LRSFEKLFICILASQQLVCLAARANASPTDEHKIWNSDHVRMIAGGENIKSNTAGTLSLTESAIAFVSPHGRATIERSKLTSVSWSEVRLEEGGTAGLIGRKAMPLLAAVAQSSVKLLAIEYRDDKNAYHGMVFQMSKSEASYLPRIFELKESSSATDSPSPACELNQHASTAMLFEKPTAEDSTVPAVYQTLAYEQLSKRIQEHAGTAQFMRSGDHASVAECPTYRLSLSLKDFQGGNVVFRALAGPLGMFSGLTSLSAQARLQDNQGNVLFNENFKVSQRGDSDSLAVTDRIAKKIADKLKTTSAQRQ